MEVKYSFICDYAAADAGGKVNVIGIFNNINVREFPCTYPAFTYVAGLKFQRSETGVHRFVLSFIDYDGNEFRPKVQGQIKVGNTMVAQNIILNLKNIKFPKATTYQIDLVVDNQVAASDTINVLQMPIKV